MMPGKKQPIDIGKRAYNEVIRLFPKMTDAESMIGCKRQAIYSWSYGVAPSSLYLARLHDLGADVIWILTGRRGA
jgi:hypothetical protein